MKGYLLLMVFVLGSLLPAAAQGQNRTITGRVTGENKSALSGVSVQVKGNTSIGVSTGADGRYSLSVPANATALTFSFLGYETREINLRPGSTTYNAMMSQSVITMGPAVVQAGIMTREAATFTGQMKQVSQAELKETGTLSAATALSLIDPSFVLVDNNLMGSNPNALPDIEINGKTTMNAQSLTDEATVNPNIPHFVIDGFDSDLATFNDLDINRIASITLLKDAGSTAIYGQKGANGVVVVETVKPKPGELMINYNFNGTVSVADLSVYNLMNAQEKFQFEVLAGYYDQLGAPAGDIENGSAYWARKSLVEKGVDTYWLKYPVRTGFSQQHNLSVAGGDGTMNYQATVGYNNKVGVMKGSKHDVMNGDVFLQYRKKDLNVSNQVLLNATNSHDGAYGSFQSWANMSPYFQPYDDEGGLVANANSNYSTLTGSGDFTANPLYNASLFTDNIGRSLSFTNNTRAEYFLSDLGLRLTGALSITRGASSNDNYKDPRHTDFRDMVAEKRGTYSYSSGNTWKWSANVAATWIKTLGEKHNFSLTGRAQADNNKTWGSTQQTEGLSYGVKPRLGMGTYVEGGRPSSSETIRRTATFMGTLGYNFDRRYLFDATLNSDGSTAFGKERLFTTNWSLGAGWVVTNEEFAQDWLWLNNLKLRGSYGTNANQAGNMLAASIYNYTIGNNYFGQAWTLGDIANPYLEWQKTTKAALGFDASFLDNNLNITLDLFSNKTNPQAISLPYPPSAGVSGYDTNLGYVNSKGYTASVNYAILRRAEDRLLFSVRLSAGTSKQQYGGFGAAFAKLSEQMANALTDIKINPDSKPSQAEMEAERAEALAKVQKYLNNNYALRNYKDGSDPDGLWAVRSLGIDPATGRELYLDEFGNPTYYYNIKDRVQIASSRAKVHGTLGFTFNYKNFRSSMNFRYSYGGSAFNSALYSRVENILNTAVLNNQDKRALYGRWKNPGDVAQFKSIKQYTSNNPISSRFIQKNNFIEAAAIQVGWDFSRSRFVEQVGLRSLVLNVSTNNLFRLSTIKMERGLDYPFAREVIFSLSTSF